MEAIVGERHYLLHLSWVLNPSLNSWPKQPAGFGLFERVFALELFHRNTGTPLFFLLRTACFYRVVVTTTVVDSLAVVVVVVGTITMFLRHRVHYSSPMSTSVLLSAQFS